MTGILPIALEEATKIVQPLLLMGKDYICIMQLHTPISENTLKAVMNEFIGEIYQRPPLRASVKRQVRIRTIYYLNLLEVRNNLALFQVGCQSGTYIRKLCFDIGEALGCGAHMKELRRTRVGPFSEDQTLANLYALAYAQAAFSGEGSETQLREIIQPLENGLALLPKVYIRDSAVDAICHGAHLAIPGILKVETGIKPNTILTLFTQKGEAVALAKATMSTEKIMEQDHGIAAKTIRVIMPINTYPKMWHTSKRVESSKNKSKS